MITMYFTLNWMNKLKLKLTTDLCGTKNYNVVRTQRKRNCKSSKISLSTKIEQHIFGGGAIPGSRGTTPLLLHHSLLSTRQHFLLFFFICLFYIHLYFISLWINGWERNVLKKGKGRNGRGRKREGREGREKGRVGPLQNYFNTTPLCNIFIVGWFCLRVCTPVHCMANQDLDGVLSLRWRIRTVESRDYISRRADTAAADDWCHLRCVGG